MSNKLIKYIPVSICLTFLMSCAAPEGKEEAGLTEGASGNAVEKYVFSHVTGDTIFFEDGAFFKSNLFETEFIGKIKNGEKAPYLIYSGRDCKECDANTSLYIHSPDDDVLDVSNGQNRNVYPGKVKHFETGTLLLEADVFYGEVTEQKSGVIWYFSEFTESGDTLLSTYLLSIDGNSLNSLQWNGHNTLMETKKLLNSGRCLEIPGREFTSEP